MAKIVWTEESLNWLELIADYISQDNPSAAVRTLEGIYSKVQLLKKNPELGFRYESIVHREVRIILYGHYRILTMSRKRRMYAFWACFTLHWM